MSTQPTQIPMPPELDNLQPPTREDALNYLQRGWRTIPRFEGTAIGKQVAKSMYPPEKVAELRVAFDERHETSVANAMAGCQVEYEEKLARRAQIEQRNAAVLEVEVAALKSRYMQAPGATEAGFAAALSDLLEERRRRAALTGQSEQERMQDQMRPNISI